MRVKEPAAAGTKPRAYAVRCRWLPWSPRAHRWAGQLLSASPGGDDLISGDEGNDVLIGFAGSDTFFLDMRTAGLSGNDSVSYFEDGIDIFKIDAASGTTFANLSVTASGTSTLVSFNGNSITITNTAPALIDASDFLFV